MIVIGTSVILLGGVLVTLGTHTEGLGIAGFIVPMIVYFLGAGLSSPSAAALALEPVPQIAGTASSAIGFSTMICGAISGFYTTKIGGSDPQVFALVVTVMGAIAAALAFTTAWARRSRR
jgi:hypothetical protein